MYDLKGLHIFCILNYKMEFVCPTKDVVEEPSCPDWTLHIAQGEIKNVGIISKNLQKKYFYLPHILFLFVKVTVSYIH